MVIGGGLELVEDQQTRAELVEVVAWLDVD
jgi:hypothetical protein